MDYPKEASRTMTDNFHSENVCCRAALHFIKEAAQTLNELDRLKKALFYGRQYMHLSNGSKLFGDCKNLCDAFENKFQAQNLIHGILGVATEAGELLENLLAATTGEKAFDFVNLKEELGDISWYHEMLCRELGETREAVEAANIEKLRKRYPEGFTEEKAIHRNTDAEIEAMLNAETK